MDADSKIEWVEIDKLIPNPRNPNHHSAEQVTRLSEIIKYQGWRSPIIVSTRSGMMAAGHGRLLAAKELKLQKVPVQYQSFIDDDQEMAFLVSDNAIASWAELDLSAINTFIPDLSPEFNIDMFGIKDFVIEPADFGPGTIDEQGKLDEKKPVECPSCGHKFTT